MALKPPIPAKRRVLHFGDTGRDVIAYQRAVKKELASLGLASTNRRSGLYGKGTLADTLRLQRRLGLKADGKVGALTWTAIDPKLDTYGIALLIPKPKPPASDGQRAAHEMRVLVAFAPRHYTQARPYATTNAKWIERGGDCSGTTSLARKNAGASDANGTDFNGYGNTWSHIVRGVRIAEQDILPGDITYYGVGGPTHEVMELGGGETGGHGSEGGPRILPRHYRSDYLETRRYP